MTAPAAPARRRPFLTARWESLVLANYPCRREWLEPLVPAGFLFTDTRLLGVPVPFHRTFEEVNLRFYVGRPGRRPGASAGARRDSHPDPGSPVPAFMPQSSPLPSPSTRR
jgi:uncharacterized protein YqjF (DUF2071 family)